MTTFCNKNLVFLFTLELENSSKKIQVSLSQQIDIYNLATGAYSPLIGFCRRDDFVTITEKMQLKDGTIWSIPIILAIDEGKAQEILSSGVHAVELIDNNNSHIASISEIEIYPFDKNSYCINIF